LIIFNSFDNKQLQAERVAEDIIKNLTKDELLYNDIIVINPIALTTKSEVSIIRGILFKKGYKTHITGASNSDVFFETNSIAFTGINRAKGNEVPMVYIINADECYSHPYFVDRDLQRRRNILFTAMTRSKAWVRVYGCGARMEALIVEYEEVKSKKFVLDFVYPSQEEIDNMNTIRRDITDDELTIHKKEVELLELLPSIIQKIQNGETSIADYSIDMQTILKTLCQ
jgi:superfamily I DNA and RNA helicase